MSELKMRLQLLVPYEVFALHTGVSRVVATTAQGSFGILPRRQDCVATLTPGILLFETDADGERYIAVDEGVLVKTGTELRVSVRRAILGGDLAQLRERVTDEFLALNEQERSVRAVMAKLETGFFRRLASFHHD